MVAATPTHSGQQEASRAAVYLGTSGWAYPAWKPEFYPAKTPAKKFLAHYAERLNSVEVNYTFRQLPSAATVAGWLEQTGAGFRFSFKAPQRITHMRRLAGCGEEVRALYAALLPVARTGRMGLVLFQLPPNFKADAARLDAFLGEAASRTVRTAFEFRHESWFSDEVYAVLRRHNAALCIAESDELETPGVETADFSCYRLRKSVYSPAALAQVEERLRASERHGDVFAYFKHEEAPAGAIFAERLLKILRTAA